MKRYFTIVAISLVILLMAGLPFVTVATPARGNASGSQNVLLIGGNEFDASGGGGLLLSSFSPGYTPTFTTIGRTGVNAATLALYDTAVLNMACYQPLINGTPSGGPRLPATEGLWCDGTRLSPAQWTDLNNFVFNGGKLIIFDSECYPGPVDYSGLMYPFTTANPGAVGQPGTLTIVEDNALSSSNSSDPEYIDYVHLGGPPCDAVGDMNVMTTRDPNWCLDMSGTNYLNVTGPTHTYARYGSGLVIYNGLDQDYMWFGRADPELIKIWELELRVPFNPTPLTALPCGIAVTGLSLTPVSATNPLNVNHEVTARVTDNYSNGIPDIPVSFNITSGPNAGLTGGPINTDNEGYASWSWTSAVEGTDTVEATANTSTTILTSLSVTKLWEVAEIVEVGGDIYSVNKLTLLAPWVALAAALILGAAVVVRRRRVRS